MNFISNILVLGIPFSVSILLASLGEMFNQKSGVFNLGCEGIMSVGAFIGFLIPFYFIKAGVDAAYINWLGIAGAIAAGALMGILFGVVVITFKAPQGIAGIGLQMFGVGVSGTLFRHFVGGITSIPGVGRAPVPLLSKIPVIGDIFFNQDPLVYAALLSVPLFQFILDKTSWGLRIKAAGTSPKAADSLGINISLVRFQALALGGAMAGLAGAYLSLFQVKMFAVNLIAGRGFIAVALVYFGHWSARGILGGALLFSLTQVLQLKIQTMGIPVPYELAVMLPYALVIIVLAFSNRNQQFAPAVLGKPFNRENRLQ